LRCVLCWLGGLGDGEGEGGRMLVYTCVYVYVCVSGWVGWLCGDYVTHHTHTHTPVPNPTHRYIHGKAYDLTDWVKHHPGGQDALLNMQGRDGTALFESYHFFTDRHRNLLVRRGLGWVVMWCGVFWLGGRGDSGDGWGLAP
jgi:hypothetical protein